MIDFIVNILIALYNLLFQDLGLTIIVIGVVSKVVFWPLSKASLQYTKKMQEIKPQLDSLKKRHAGDRKRQAEEQSKFLKEVGVNPAAGCLPVLVQVVVFIFLYQAVTALIHRGLDTSFLFWDLAKPDVFHLSGVPFAIPGLLVLLTAVATFGQSKMMMPEPVKVNKDDKLKEKKEKQDFAGTMAEAQGQMLFLTPIIIIFFGTTLPSGLGLYWLVSTVVAIIQQYQLIGPGGLKGWLKKVNLAK